MSTRTVRINELVQRELSGYLRKHYATEAATITISGVEIAPDLRTGKVFVSVIGSEADAIARHTWLVRRSVELRKEIGRRVVMKWTPELTYILDQTPERAQRVLRLLDEIALQPLSQQPEQPSPTQTPEQPQA